MRTFEHNRSKTILPAIAIGLAVTALSSSCETTSGNTKSYSHTNPPNLEAELYTPPSVEPSEPESSNSEAAETQVEMPIYVNEPIDPIVQLQNGLNEILVPLGMPELELDGKEGPQTNRAECAYRLFTGQEPSTVDFSEDEIKAFAEPSPITTTLSGFIISETCQVVGVNIDGDSDLELIAPASTGKPGRGTPKGSFQVLFGRNYDHNSTVYPSAGPNMYRPIYFYYGRSGIAIHGSPAMSPASTTARSHGCVRVEDHIADILWEYAGGEPELATGPNRSARVELDPIEVHVLF